MSYRKIIVDDVEYEYIVGKTHVKIKGIGYWPKEEIGRTIDDRCTVAPSHIESKIRQYI